MKENQKKAEEQIRQHEEFLQSITTHMGEGLVVMDEAGRLSYMNPVAEQILGWSKEECMDQNMHEMIHRRKDGNSIAYEDCLSTKSSQNGEVYQVEEDWFIRKNGPRFPM